MCNKIRTEDGKEYRVVTTGFDKYKDKVVVGLLVLIMGGIVTSVYKSVTQAPLQDERIAVLQREIEDKASAESVVALSLQLEKIILKMDDRFTGKDHETYAASQDSRDSGQDLAISENRAEARLLSRDLTEDHARLAALAQIVDDNKSRIEFLVERVVRLEAAVAQREIVEE